MSSHTVIDMESVANENSKHKFKTAAIAATAVGKVKSAWKKRSGSSGSFEMPQWPKKRTNSKQLSLDKITFQNTTPIYTLAAEGRLDELKSAIETHELTLKEVDKNGYTLLHHAASHNQEDVMQYLIDSGIDLDAVDNDGNTALHLAAEGDIAEACHLLLASGANDTILNHDSNAPLHIAATGKNKALAAILDHPVDIAVKGYLQRMAFHIFSEHDNIEGLQIFSQKAEVVLNDKNVLLKLCSADDDGMTPNHLAARNNSHRILDYTIEICIKKGYSIERILGFLDEENSTPLQAAVDSGHSQVAEVLLKHGASPIDSKGDIIPPLHLACCQGRCAMVKMMVEYAGCEILSHTDQFQRTPLHYCALSIHSSSMIPLVVEKAKGIVDLNAQDDRGRTPLHNAIKSSNLLGTKELLVYGADPLKKDDCGLNALHLALYRNTKKIVNTLLELPIATELVRDFCSKGYNALHLAIHLGHGDLIPKMISAVNFEVQNTQDGNGDNYLHLAACKGDAKTLAALLDVPAIRQLINESNNDRGTPLHFATLGGNHYCLDLLLNNGAMIHRCKGGNTPLMGACMKGFTDCAKILLRAHPGLLYMNNYREESPLHYAAFSKTPSTVSLMLDEGCELSLNVDSKSFFDMIINAADYDCAMAVVNHDRWHECLDFSTPLHPSPMIGLVQQMPEVAKIVLDRCHTKADDLNTSHQDFWESFDFKYLYLKHDKPSLPVESPSHDVHIDMEEHNIATVQYKGAQNTQSQVATFDKDDHQMSTQSNRVDTMAVLKEMRSYKRVNLLTHPVVNSFLASKWRRYGRFIYTSMYLFQVVMVLLLSTFVLIVPNPTQTAGNLSLVNKTVPNITKSSVPEISTAAQVIRAFALLFNAIFILRLVLSLLYSGSKFTRCLRQISFWVNSFTVIFIFVFLLAPNPLFIWPVGAVSCFFAWFSLLLGLEYFAVPGTIVKMFLAVTKTVFLVLSLCVFLLLAFAFAFYILGGGLSDFSNIGYSFFSMFGFMLGELPYEDYVKHDVAGNLVYGKFLLIFILLLAILLSIVIANLLIGLAIGDIERIKLNAILEKKATEIGFFSQLDQALPKRYLNHVLLKTYRHCPNAKKCFILGLWRDAWKWIEEDVLEIETEQSNATSPTSSTDQTAEMSQLKMHVLDLKDMLQQMQVRQTLKRQSSSWSLNSFDLENSEYSLKPGQNMNRRNFKVVI